MFTSKRKSGRLFIELSMTEKRAKRIRDHCARTFLEIEVCKRNVRTSLVLKRLSLCIILFFIKAAKKLVVESPTTVDLSLISLLTEFPLSHRDNPTSRHGVLKKRLLPHWRL